MSPLSKSRCCCAGAFRRLSIAWASGVIEVRLPKYPSRDAHPAAGCRSAVLELASRAMARGVACLAGLRMRGEGPRRPPRLPPQGQASLLTQQALAKATLPSNGSHYKTRALPEAAKGTAGQMSTSSEHRGKECKPINVQQSTRSRRRKHPPTRDRVALLKRASAQDLDIHRCAQPMCAPKDACQESPYVSNLAK